MMENLRTVIAWGEGLEMGQRLAGKGHGNFLGEGNDP